MMPAFSSNLILLYFINLIILNYLREICAVRSCGERCREEEEEERRQVAENRGPSNRHASDGWRGCDAQLPDNRR